MQQDSNKNERPAQFPPQEAPTKNTDNAFVKVGKDGQPELPATSKEKEEKEHERSGSRS